MKVGVVSHGSPDYLIDIVTDGLIRLLGRESVSLDYNARGGWGGQYSILLQGFQGPEPFDIEEAEVLIASVRSLDAAKAWMKRTGKKKVAIVDGEDGADIRSPWEMVASVYFKREYFKNRDYVSSIHPLPFGAIPEALPDVSSISCPIFFLAHESSGVRAEVVKVLRGLGYDVPSERIEKAEYNKRLASSLVGISARGGGWDTYRYWEVAYFGTALLSQRLEIMIPNDFEEGLEIEFFENMMDLEKKLKMMVEHPDQTILIGQRARKKCLKYHLSENRARTVLEALL